eukprot:7552662-Pyramimonas_sp.AAC.1
MPVPPRGPGPHKRRGTAPKSPSTSTRQSEEAGKSMRWEGGLSRLGPGPPQGIREHSKSVSTLG